MAHYTGPKGRINRRLGVAIYESKGAMKALDRRDSPPGMHLRRGKSSVYGLALLEKQKLKHLYGLGERTMRRVFAIARRQTGNTAEALLSLLERRIDNVIRRAGFCATRPQARQGVVHGHFLLNGRKIDRPSFLVRPGDVIDIAPRHNLRAIYRDRIAESESVVPDWIHADVDQMRIFVSGTPSMADIRVPLDIGLAVESLSRN